MISICMPLADIRLGKTVTGSIAALTIRAAWHFRSIGSLPGMAAVLAIAAAVRRLAVGCCSMVSSGSPSVSSFSIRVCRLASCAFLRGLDHCLHPGTFEQHVAQAFVVLFKMGDAGHGIVASGALAFVLPAALCLVLQRTGPAIHGTKQGTKTIDFGAWGGTF